MPSIKSSAMKQSKQELKMLFQLTTGLLVALAPSTLLKVLSRLLLNLKSSSSSTPLKAQLKRG